MSCGDLRRLCCLPPSTVYQRCVDHNPGRTHHSRCSSSPGQVKAYMSSIANRRNSITGVLYKDDPVIFSWNLMNEPRESGCLFGGADRLCGRRLAPGRSAWQECRQLRGEVRQVHVWCHTTCERERVAFV